MKFIEKHISGLEPDIERHIARWKKWGTGVSLHEYLGLTFWEFKLYREDPKEFFQHLKEMRRVTFSEILSAAWMSRHAPGEDQEHYANQLEKRARAWFRKTQI